MREFVWEQAINIPANSAREIVYMLTITTIVKYNLQLYLRKFSQK